MRSRSTPISSLRGLSLCAILLSTAACATATPEAPFESEAVEVLEGLYEGTLPQDVAPDDGAIIFRAGT
jgi:hypothetical protein